MRCRLGAGRIRILRCRLGTGRVRVVRRWWRRVRIAERGSRRPGACSLRLPGCVLALADGRTRREQRAGRSRSCTRVRRGVGGHGMSRTGSVRVLNLASDRSLGRVIVLIGRRRVRAGRERLHLRSERDGLVRGGRRAGRRHRVVVGCALRSGVNWWSVADLTLALVPNSAALRVKLLMHGDRLAVPRRRAHLVLERRRHARWSGRHGAGAKRRRDAWRLRSSPSRERRDGRSCLEPVILGRRSARASSTPRRSARRGDDRLALCWGLRLGRSSALWRRRVLSRYRRNWRRRLARREGAGDGCRLEVGARRMARWWARRSRAERRIKGCRLRRLRR